MLIGMPICIQILEANAQLKRRFQTQTTLAPFGWNHPNDKVRAQLQTEFRTFLKELDKRLPLIERSYVLTEEMTAWRIYCATDGVVDKITKLVRRAAFLALEQGAEKLTPELLAQAYDERLALNKPGMKNPFLA